MTSKQGKPLMYVDTALSAAAERNIVRPSLEEQIAAFLDGRTHGEELLHALYDHVLDEPIPPQMRALLGG
jgi:hypothetical protein